MSVERALRTTWTVGTTAICFLGGLYVAHIGRTWELRAGGWLIAVFAVLGLLADVLKALRKR